MEKQIDFMHAFLYWYPGNGKTFLFVIHVCVVLVPWQWKNKITSQFAFYN